ncbi:hypothetical protein PRIPAC_79699 [Pristionchus pacificus]|uniref:G protein-coupled receptor n=1 Tax=Pristionchus pacificus TaxID=54126 RepID=A0A2A6CJP9_PRIPA|nr:hypothetical protein PRIPAC_79699 [Pristionchus pacificus]|eukprot:PDM78308.1 G protein-coupled receptor [Pristionchus pacificus]
MVLFATAFILTTFAIGSSFCCLALWTIHKSKTLRESFGLLCKYQMVADLSLLTLSTFYCLFPKEYAPKDSSTMNIVICFMCEIFYHYSGAMHDLFAVNRFVYIVFPDMQQQWRNATPKILFVCAIITIWHTLLMMMLDINLYWTYDRDTFVWHMTDTPWTEFYVQYFELYWSTGELGLIVLLDTITFSHILFKKSKIAESEVHMNRRAETRLILQSFCQCIPTTTVNIIFFFVFPGTKSPNLQTVYSAIWIVTNIMDA